MIGNKPCGVLWVMGGKTVDDVIGLDVLTYVAVEQAPGEKTFRVRVPHRGVAAIDLARRHVH
jgi:hypothetical protein